MHIVGFLLFRKAFQVSNLRIGRIVNILLLAFTMTVGGFIAVFADDAEVAPESETLTASGTVIADDDAAKATEVTENEDPENSDSSSGVESLDSEEDDPAGFIDSNRNDADDSDADDTNPSRKDDNSQDSSSHADVKDDDSKTVYVHQPSYVSITDFGNTNSYAAEKDGTVRISGLFNVFDPDAFGSESFVMLVGGRRYPITIYSDGTVSGRLPNGFSIEDGELVIKGVTGSMDIEFANHTMISGIYVDGTFEEPAATDTASNSARKHQDNSTPVMSAAVYPLAEKAAPTENDDAVSNAAVVPEAGNDSDSQVLGTYSDNSKGGLMPIAAEIVLAAGAATGLGVLLKLKIFAP